MLLIDFSNMAFGGVLDFYQKTGIQPEDNAIRSMILIDIMRANKQLKKFGDVVLCCDDRNYWRRDIFPHYKASRKARREADDFDWGKFFQFFDNFKSEIKEHFPARIIQVPGAEADDIVAVLASRFGSSEDVCIWSSDTDNLQLQALSPKIKQWSPYKRKFITPKSEEYSLFEHIVKGDSGDGIPNIKSPSDCLVNKVRQKPIRTADWKKWEVDHGLSNPEGFCDTPEMLERFKLNKQLVDYNHIPKEVSERIIEAFNESKVPKGRLFTYLVNHKLKNVITEGGF